MLSEPETQTHTSQTTVKHLEEVVGSQGDSEWEPLQSPEAKTFHLPCAHHELGIQDVAVWSLLLAFQAGIIASFMTVCDGWLFIGCSACSPSTRLH